MPIEDMESPESPFTPRDLAGMLSAGETLNEAASESLVESYVEGYNKEIAKADGMSDVVTYMIGELALLRALTDTLFAGFAMVSVLLDEDDKKDDDNKE